MRQKHVRVLQVAGWEKNLKAIEMVVKGVEQLVQAQVKWSKTFVNEPSKRLLLLESAQMLLGPIVKRVEELFAQSEPYQRLCSLVQEIQEEQKS